jgi:membrane protein implicated in regulation of membrane protease activity
MNSKATRILRYQVRGAAVICALAGAATGAWPWLLGCFLLLVVISVSQASERLSRVVQEEIDGPRSDAREVPPDVRSDR